MLFWLGSSVVNNAHAGVGELETSHTRVVMRLEFA